MSQEFGCTNAYLEIAVLPIVLYYEFLVKKVICSCIRKELHLSSGMNASRVPSNALEMYFLVPLLCL